MRRSLINNALAAQGANACFEITLLISSWGIVSRFSFTAIQSKVSCNLVDILI